MPDKVTLPQSREAEKAVLGAALMDLASLSCACVSLTANDFTDPKNRSVFEAVLSLFKEKKAVDPATVTDRLQASGKLDFCGGPEYLQDLVDSCITPDNTPFYSRAVRENTLLRDFLLTLDGVIKDYKAERPKSPMAFLADASSKIQQAAAKSAGEGFKDSKAVAASLWADVEAEIGSGRRGLIGVDTGFPKLNELTHGWQAGDLIIVAGRPSMGKTAFGCNAAYNCLEKGCGSVGFFSFEMTSKQIMARLVSISSGVEGDKLSSGALSQSDMGRARAANSEIANWPLYFDDESTGLLGEVVGDAQRLKIATGNLALIVVDYIGLMKLGSRAESRQVEVSQISGGLKRMAMSLGVPVIALCQLNRSTEENPGAVPTMANLRESGSIEQDADVVMLLHRPSYYEKDEQRMSQTTVIVAKNRKGKTGAVELTFDRATAKFAESEARALEKESGDSGWKPNKKKGASNRGGWGEE